MLNLKIETYFGLQHTAEPKNRNLIWTSTVCVLKIL